ncbi:MAG: carbohydrate kinase [Planctomycetes bacterium DG_23]|nr:MAG: carbohydrate kinase [Planctomycetes bacterium DG_23]
MADYLMGIDYGTGGAKVCIINPEGEVLGFVFEEYPFIHEKPGWSEHDPLLYWQIACRLIAEAIAQAHINPRNIRGIAVSSALPSMVMVDKDHNPIHRAYNLMDRRATKEVEWLKGTIGEDRIFKSSGNRMEDHPTIVNLLWEKNNRPDSFKRIHKALTIDGFITLKLTGKAVLNYSAACFYGVAYNIRQRQFDEKLLQEIGIPLDLMPDLFECTEIVGEVTREAAAETGLVSGIPVAAGQVDCNAGYLGAGAIEEGDFQSNLGSVGNFGVIHKNTDFIFSPVGYVMINFAYTVDSKNTYITVPSTTTGGQSIRYLRDNFSQMEVEMERALGVSSYDLLNLQAEKIPPGSEGLIILPFLMGERTPIWDVYARGVIFGLSLNHTKGHIVRAMMEAVAYALYDSFRLIKEAGLKINYPLVLNEGGAVSKLWRKIIADVFDVPLVLVKRRTGAPFGDAILAGVATGVFKDFAVAKQWAEYIEPMEPSQENHQRYMQYFDLYKRLYENVKDDFRALARLRDKS